MTLICLTRDKTQLLTYCFFLKKIDQNNFILIILKEYIDQFGLIFLTRDPEPIL
jgi:hypothetical protein